MKSLMAIGLLWAAAWACASETWTMTNPTGLAYSNELVRIKVDVPEDISRDAYTVTEDGKEVPWQIEELGGKRYIWVATDLAKGQTREYRLLKGRSARSKPLVSVEKRGEWWTLENGLMAVRAPSFDESSKGKPAGEISPVGQVGPVGQVRLPDGKWVGRSVWKTDRKVTNCTARAIGDGTVFGKIRVRYEFEGTGGLFNETPSFYQADIALGPGRRHAVIEESFAMGRGDYWEIDIAHGWDARGAVVRPHFGGFGRPTMKDPAGNPYSWPPNTLSVGQTRMHDTLLNLIPRWSQAYDDGWMFMATDGTSGVGAIACRAGKWLWPHDSMIEIRVKESADFAGVRCPTWRGRRYWYLVAGPKETWESDRAGEAYVLRHACEGLDKLHQEYILDWPGLRPPEGKTLTPEQAAAWSSGAGRFSRRDRPFPGWGPSGAHWSGEDHPIKTLTRVQNMFDPDTYGNHWLFFSPENPNFFSHWVNGMFEGLEKLQSHPRFDAIRALAVQKAREELYFGVTLPGGAGQECFGYMSRGSWQKRADFCKEHLGVEIDSAKWPWRKSAGSYILRTSHPMPDGSRRAHPGGDTHPPGPDPFEAARAVGALVDVTTLRTEELPGFGVVLRNGSGTPQETYFAFKSGPNRGHFHGDQLAFHYCAYGRPLAVDHHASYAPRPGQEHMHNRVAFHTETLPYANMDGYERLIAFKTSDEADIAVGQVGSERLRITEKYPPEKWDWRLPQEALTPGLEYRRTVVRLKGDAPGQDVFVIRDQYAGPEVYATYCLHVLGGRCTRQGNVFDFDGLRLHVVSPDSDSFAVAHHDWEHKYGGVEATKGLRLTLNKGRQGSFVTVLAPRPPKRCTVASLALKQAFSKEHRERGASASETIHVDLNVLAVYSDGRLMPGPATVTASDSRGHGYAFAGAVEVGDGGATRIVAKGVAGRFNYTHATADYAVELKIHGDTITGTWSGRWIEEGGKPAAADDAEKAKGIARQGVLTGVLQRDVLAPVPLFDEEWDGPPVQPVPGGVRVGEVDVIFDGGIDDDESTPYVVLKRGGKELQKLAGADIDMDRSQGEIGLFVPDAGYPFGVIPDWLIRQRSKVPDWYEESWPPTRQAPGRSVVERE